MKTLQEFKGYRTRIEFDASAGRFVQQPAASPVGRLPDAPTASARRQADCTLLAESCRSALPGRSHKKPKRLRPIVLQPLNLGRDPAKAEWPVHSDLHWGRNQRF